MSPGGLRIGINALYLIPGGVGGTEIYLRSLLPAMARLGRPHTFFVYLNRETGGDLLPAGGQFIARRQPVQATFRPGRLVWEQTILPRAASRDRVEVLFNPGFTAPARAGAPCVTVFHDLQHKRRPENFRWYDRPFWNLFLGLAVRTSARLIVTTESNRQDLARYYPHAAEKARVVPLGVDPVFFDVGRERQNLHADPFVLSVSTLHPHKNYERLLEAFARFRRKRPDFHLVITGVKGLRTRQIEQRVRDLGLGDSVRITGWIPREELYGLYRRATASIYASTFEGFGLPVLEAMAARVPLACSAIEPLLGLTGTGALHFDPLRIDSIEEALLRITDEPALRAALSEAGPRQAARFTWEETARGTLAVLEEAAQAARSSR